jgi:hypothetical protein
MDSIWNDKNTYFLTGNVLNGLAHVFGNANGSGFHSKPSSKTCAVLFSSSLTNSANWPKALSAAALSKDHKTNPLGIEQMYGTYDSISLNTSRAKRKLSTAAGTPQ